MLDKILFIDKEKGKTSFDVVRDVRKSLNVRKVGHAGTLDPMATGLMIVAIGEATKLLEFLLHEDKVYEGELKFGFVSDTYDALGNISEFSYPDKEFLNEKSPIPPSLSLIKKIVHERFCGKISQIPPKFSAKKINGERAYNLARKGIDFSVNASDVFINSFDILSYDWPFMNFRIDCSSGTYIRSIVNDLGVGLSCGAYMTSLRRISIGRFLIDSVRLGLGGYSIEEVFLDSPFVKIEIDDAEYESLYNGGFVFNKKNIQDKTFFACYRGKIVGVCEPVLSGDFIKFRKRLNVSF